MTIVFDDSLIAIWHVFIPEHPGQAKSDFMAALARLGDGEFKLTYRFRYYADNKAFDSKDRKNWYAGVLSGDEGVVIAKVREVVEVLTKAGGTEVDELLRGPGMSTDAFLAELGKRPWAHAQAVPMHPAGHA